MIAITGTGLMSCVGKDVVENFTSFQNGICGNKNITGFDTKNYNLKYAYEITPTKNNLNVEDWVINVINQALLESNNEVDKDTIIIIGTGLRNIKKYENATKQDITIPKTDLDLKCIILENFKNVKDVISITNACSASLYALALGSDMLNLGLASKVIIVGSDNISETMFGLGDRVSPLIPTKVQSFDKQRKGVLLGDGAAAIILENKNNNNSDDELIILKSVELTCDAKHETQPCSIMIESTICQAINKANITPMDVDIVFAHGTGTVLNDIAEGKALDNIFKNNNKIQITGLKPMIGHTSGASGLMSVIAASLCLKHNRTIPLINLEEPIEEVNNLRFVKESQHEKLTVAQIDAFGFGGLNAVAIIRKENG